jgi:hypothetical protein
VLLCRSREADLEREVKLLQTRLTEVLERPGAATARSTPLPLSKSSSFVLAGKNVPLDPQARTGNRKCCFTYNIKTTALLKMTTNTYERC